ncbi:histidinol phosphatase [Clostridium tarantellae]|uniref:Histidinol phosphatase n=1 Tax=Clostridium tarantellae TaxID=39493 RepID=A0A6I1MMS4_9CLOT|nr:histidinol phosphatase [Clostridium tarantellae]MPQ44695.1 histidinol phosphatase [Clostridium tarantellae]
MIKKRKLPEETNLNINDLKFYYGIPHCHTALSTGRGTPIEALEYGKKNGLDYMIITDHNGYLNEQIRDKDGSTLTKWKFLQKCLYKFNKKYDNFIALYGFESHSYPWGDLNIINADTYFNGTITNLNHFLLWLLSNENTLVSINHPHKTIEKLNFNLYLDKFICSIELGNGSPPNKYSRYDKYYFSLLDKGWHLGAINSQDNHRMNFGENENLTGIISTSLSKESIINAFKNRHCFSTESKTLKMFFTINSTFMGGNLTIYKNSNLDFYIYAEDSEKKINKIEILTNGGTIVKNLNNINLNRIKYIFKKNTCFQETWYIIKIYLEDKKNAISSPIFISASEEFLNS